MNKLTVVATFPSRSAAYFEILDGNLFPTERVCRVYPGVGETGEQCKARANRLAKLIEKGFLHACQEAAQALSEAKQKQAVQRLLERHEGHIDQDALDDAVHGVAADAASAINNGGMAEQIEFLIREIGEDETDKVLTCYALD